MYESSLYFKLLSWLVIQHLTASTGLICGWMAYLSQIILAKATKWMAATPVRRMSVCNRELKVGLKYKLQVTIG